MKKRDVVEKLTQNGLNATPKVVNLIANRGEETLNTILENEINKSILELEDIETYVYKQGKKENKNQEKKSLNNKKNKPDNSDNNLKTKIGDRSIEKTKKIENKKDVSNNFSHNIYKDITGNSTSTGEYEDFRKLYRHRFERLSDILRSRLSPTSIGDVRKKTINEISIVGIVKDIWTTKSGNYILKLEDPTGEISVHISDKKAENIVGDEVIGVKGKLQDDIIFSDTIYFPDIPRSRKKQNTSNKETKIAFVGDLHVGSNEFDEKKWRNFKKWISQNEQIKYLVVAGDLADGVGVYSGQEKELEIQSIKEQYKKCAELFTDIPFEIITIPGNHDAVRRAEPQPALPKDLQKLFDNNVIFSGNPSTIEIEGVKIVMYHGTSINPFVEKIPEASLENPETVMEIMLKKRHLAPMHGDIRIAPEHQDYLLIENTPDILHTGHSHIRGIGRYKGVTMINSGAWQKQTKYQKSKGIKPDVGYATIVDLTTLEIEIRSF